MGYIVAFMAGMVVMFALVNVLTGKPKNKSKVTFIKVIVSIVVGHGLTMTTASYILAYFDKNPVCEVSVVLITEVVAPVIIYALTKMFENIFEKNKLTFSEPIKFIKEKMENEEL